MKKYDEDIIIYHRNTNKGDFYLWDGYSCDRNFPTMVFGELLSNIDKVVVVYIAKDGRYAYLPYQKFQRWSSNNLDIADNMSSFLSYISILVKEGNGIYVGNKFNNKYNLNLPTKPLNLELKKGEAFVAYNADLYSEGKGTLNNSCMRHSGGLTIHSDVAFDSKFYDDHSYSLILWEGDKIRARALVWQTTKCDFMDRVYWSQQEQESKYFIDYCVENGIEYNNVLSGSFEDISLKIELKKRLWKYDFVPYMDTFQNSDEDYLYSYNEGECVLDQTDGSYEKKNTTYCETCGDSIDLDNDYYYYYENHGVYYCCENCYERDGLVLIDDELHHRDNVYYCEECDTWQIEYNECGCMYCCDNCGKEVAHSDIISGDEGVYCCTECLYEVEEEEDEAV